MYSDGGCVVCIQMVQMKNAWVELLIASAGICYDFQINCQCTTSD